MIEELIGDLEITDARRATLESAITLGATHETLVAIRDAVRTSKDRTIILPAHRYERLSCGKGWCRMGRGDKAAWGERADGGYRVGPGHWIVGASDGFSRKGSTEWDVSHVTVGDQIWTVAS